MVSQDPLSKRPRSMVRRASNREDYTSSELDISENN